MECKGKLYKLPGPLVISLISYPPRVGPPPLNLRCLVIQTTAADRAILWIAPGPGGRVREIGILFMGAEPKLKKSRGNSSDISSLPRYVMQLQQTGRRSDRIKMGQSG